MIFDKMIDRSVLDNGVHDFRGGEVSELPTQRCSQGFPAGAATEVLTPTVATNGSMVSAITFAYLHCAPISYGNLTDHDVD